MCPRRQDLEERCFLNLYQNWELRAEEHLTLKQEEGEAARGAPRRGVRTLILWGSQSWGGGGYRPDHHPMPTQPCGVGPVEGQARGWCGAGSWPTRAHCGVGGQNSCWVLSLGVQDASQFHSHLAQ